MTAPSTFELEAGTLHLTRVRFLDVRVARANHAGESRSGNSRRRARDRGRGGFRGDARRPRQCAGAGRPDECRTYENCRRRALCRRNWCGASRVITFPEGLKHQLRLLPGDEFTLRVDVVPEDGRPVIDFGVGLDEARAVYPRWAAQCMSIETDNSELNELLAQATADIRMLCDHHDTGIYPTAGLPWFAVPFGRDALISSILLLHVNPELARGVLRYLAKHQGRRVDHDSDEAARQDPARGPHRRGSGARLVAAQPIRHHRRHRAVSVRAHGDGALDPRPQVR